MLGNADRTDLDFLKNGLLFPFINSTDIYKCAGDKTAHIRSMSMNAWMNPINTEGQMDPRYVIYKKQSHIRNPVETWVTIEGGAASSEEASELVMNASQCSLPCSHHKRYAAVWVPWPHQVTRP